MIASGARPGGHGQRLPPGPRGEHVVLPGQQVDPQRPQQLGLILDDQHRVRVAPARARGPEPGAPEPGGSGRGFRLGIGSAQPDLADSSSSLIFKVSTLTVGSPRKPSVRPVMFCVTRLRTSSAGRCLAAATRSTWM